MNTSPVFEWLCTEITQRTSLPELQTRGTIRLALQEAGLEPRTLTKVQALVVVERLLPKELTARRVADAGAVCTQVALALRLMTFASSGPESAESAFARLGRK